MIRQPPSSTLFPYTPLCRSLPCAGFEAAATMGEGAREPRRDIPRAILGVAIFGGLYFVFVTAVEVMGFGTDARGVEDLDRKSTRLNSSHANISYAVFCLKKKKNTHIPVYFLIVCIVL